MNFFVFHIYSTPFIIFILAEIFNFVNMKLNV